MSAHFYDLRGLKACGEDVRVSIHVEIKHPHLVRLGQHVAIDSGFYCTTRLELGDYIHIGPQVTVIGGANGLLRMDHFSGLAAGARIVSSSEIYGGDGLVGPVVPAAYRDQVVTAPVVIERMATVCTNAVVLPGVTIAEGSVVSACSLVIKDTEPWMIYAGVPARAIRVRPRDKMLAAAKALGYA